MGELRREGIVRWEAIAVEDRNMPQCSRIKPHSSSILTLGYPCHGNETPTSMRRIASFF